MKLKDYMTEGYHMSYKQVDKNGQEYSDGEDFANKREAVKTLNAYRYSADTDSIKNEYWFDDEGNIVSIVDNGKVPKKKRTIKDLGG